MQTEKDMRGGKTQRQAYLSVIHIRTKLLLKG